jgi:hypothetical protein
VLGADDQTLDVQDQVGDVLLDPGTVVNSCRTPSMRMLVTEAPGDRGEQRAAQGVAEGVAEAGLQRLDDEPERASVTTSSERVGRWAMSTGVPFRDDRYLTSRAGPGGLGRPGSGCYFE